MKCHIYAEHSWSSLFLFLPATTLFSALITYTIRMYVSDIETIGQVHGDFMPSQHSVALLECLQRVMCLFPLYTIHAYILWAWFVCCLSRLSYTEDTFNTLNS